MTKPEITRLLTTARKDLLQHLLPNLADEHHYQALMVANAIRISNREIAHGDRTTSENERLLLELSDPEAGETPQVLDRKAVQAIRSGVFDEPTKRTLLLKSLLGITHNNLTISNPKMIRHQL